MNIEKQVTSLELSQKLKELGVPQESLFYYGYPCCEEDSNIDIYYTHEEGMATQDCSAFTAGELGEIFGKTKFDGKTMRCMFVPDSKDKNWIYRVYLADDRDEDSYTIESAGTEADARAKMLIHLIENKLINVKDL